MAGSTAMVVQPTAQRILSRLWDPEWSRGGGQGVQKVINTEGKIYLEEWGREWEEVWQWFNSNCHVAAWNGGRLILALIWIYIILSLGEDYDSAAERGKVENWGSPWGHVQSYYFCTRVVMVSLVSLKQAKCIAWQVAFQGALTSMLIIRFYIECAVNFFVVKSKIQRGI